MRSCRHLRELHVQYSQVQDEDLARLLELSDTLFLFSYGDMSSPEDRDEVRKAVIQTQGRTLVTTGFEGLIEFSNVPQTIQDQATRSKALVQQASDDAQNPDIFNEWQALF